MGLLKPFTPTVTLYHGDDLEQLAELRRAVVRAENARGPARKGDTIPGAAERAALEEFAGEAAERALGVRLSPIGSTRFASLMLDHPPRMVDGEDGKRTHEDDEPFGVNTLTFPKALLAYRDERRDEKRTILDIDGTDLTTDELRDFLDDDCTTGHIESLWTKAWALNRSEATGNPLGEPTSMSGFPN